MCAMGVNPVCTKSMREALTTEVNPLVTPEWRMYLVVTYGSSQTWVIQVSKPFSALSKKRLKIFILNEIKKEDEGWQEMKQEEWSCMKVAQIWQRWEADLGRVMLEDEGMSACVQIKQGGTCGVI